MPYIKYKGKFYGSGPTEVGVLTNKGVSIIPIINIGNYVSGYTSNLVSKSSLNVYTGTTAPATYETITNFNAFTGTTAPLTYQSKSSINTFTGTTLPNLFKSGSTTGFILDNQAGTPNTFGYKANFDIKGQGQIKVTNGSSSISGISTNFLNASTGVGLSYWFNLWVKDSASNWYYATLATIPTNTTATISKIHSKNQMLLGSMNTSGNANVPVTTSTYTGVTGTYDYWIVRSWSDGLFSSVFGTSAYANNFSFAAGGNAVALATASIAIGQQNFSKVANALTIGTQCRAIGLQSTAIGYRSEANANFSVAIGQTAIANGLSSVAIGNGQDATGTVNDKPLTAGGTGSVIISTNDTSQTQGHGALANYSGIFAGLDHNIPTGGTRSAIIGGNLIKAVNGITDTVYMPKVRIGQGTGGAITSGSTSIDVLMRGPAGEIQSKTVTQVLSGLTANNGVVRGGNTFHLGGTFTGSTRISMGANNFNLTGSTGQVTITNLGISTGGKFGLGVTPIIQVTTAVGASTVSTTGNTLLATFDGYTIAKVVKALRNYGILA